MMTGNTLNAKIKPISLRPMLPNKNSMPLVPQDNTWEIPDDKVLSTCCPSGRYNAKAPKQNCNAKAIETVRQLIALRDFETRKANDKMTTMASRLIKVVKVESRD